MTHRRMPSILLSIYIALSALSFFSCDLLTVAPTESELTDTIDETTPRAPSIRNMSLGFQNSMVLREDGILLASGSNNSAQMGASDLPNRFDLGVIRIGVKNVFCGGTGAFFAMEDARLYVSGDNFFGQLGAGTNRYVTSRLISLGSGLEVRQIAFAGTATLALDSQGSVWVTGENYEGTARSSAGITPSGNVFQKLSETNYLDKVVAIAGSSKHSLFLLEDRTVWSCGTNTDGRLGTGDFIGDVAARQMNTITDAIAIAAGKTHSLVLTADGDLYACGSNTDYQIGSGDASMTQYPSPTRVMTKVVAIAAGDYSSYALTSDGELFVSGDNSSGQLGTGTLDDVNGFTSILSGVSAIAAGPKHAYFLKSDGTLWGAGYNYFGQLGDCTTVDKKRPVRIYF
ncbi:MAG: hypothetical protein Q8O15_01560 [Rectinemataceae bacterium]|nr:hypothetical protein [Rectinemataceae bacterium]